MRQWKITKAEYRYMLGVYREMASAMNRVNVPFLVCGHRFKYYYFIGSLEEFQDFKRRAQSLHW